MKIIEWNINHRAGQIVREMPEWVSEYIQEKHADIVVLTEVSFRIPNLEEQMKNMFNMSEYNVFYSFNTQNNQNDLVIAIKKESFDFISQQSFSSNAGKYPDNLIVSCIHKETGKKIMIVGMRIHALHGVRDNNEKREEFKNMLDYLKDKDNVIIVGDFNNYRCGYHDPNHIWDLENVKSLGNSYNYRMYTPEGGSIYCDHYNDKAQYFPEDHIFVKGQVKVTKTLYDRDFVNKDKMIYKWGKDFQGQFDGRKSPKINPPYPDHALLECELSIDALI